jgi:hypothetical protein
MATTLVQAMNCAFVSWKSVAAARLAQRNVQPFLWRYIRDHYIITVDQGLLHAYKTDKAVTCTNTANAKLQLY